jgi:hypothetical protein
VERSWVAYTFVPPTLENITLASKPILKAPYHGLPLARLIAIEDVLAQLPVK